MRARSQHNCRRIKYPTAGCIVTLFFLVITGPGCQRQKSETAPVVVQISNEVAASVEQDIWAGYEKTPPPLAQQYPRLLPAYELPFERMRTGKADQYDDFRAQNKEWFAITIPPSDVKASVKGMVEWEDMQALLLSADGDPYPSSMDQNVADLAWYSIHEAGVAVYIMYTSDQHRSIVQGKFDAYGPSWTEDAMLHWVNKTTGSIWMIDYGPISIKDENDNIAFADFRYYHYRVWDDALSTRLGHDVFDVDTFRVPISLEGGNLQMDSMGTCYMTQGVLWANAMPDPVLKSTMGDYLGCNQVVVLAPLAEEGTHHVDMFFKLVDDHTVILGDYSWNQDPTNAQLLDANADILEAVVLPDGQGLNVVRMPMPSNSNQSVWRTYINATFVAGPLGKVNAWPTYNLDEDLEDDAASIWASTMPGWSHVKFPADTVITWGGAIHCISRTIPEGNLNRWVPAGNCSNGTCNANNSNAYSGSCNVETGCNGPKWLCDSNDCGTPCSGVTWEGCCENNQLYSCENGALTSYNCGSSGSCGWDSQNQYYNCGTSGEGPAAYPIDCPWNSCEPSCAGKSCGDNGCGGSCGTCAANETCNSGNCVAVCAPNCAGLSCGDDGCGGSCGSCGFNEVCDSGACILDPDCDGLTYEGCCSEGIVEWCEGGETKTFDCGSADNCGWNGEQNYFWCGGSDEPPAEFPMDCNDNSCTPSCDGAVCGANGCGGSCGSCETGFGCIEGACVCLPQCGGVECGDNGCGGSCGSCGDGSSCVDGLCSCAPQCDGKECGPNSCGGTCGTCSGDEECNEGICASPGDLCAGIGPAGVCQDDTLLSCTPDGTIDSTECDNCCGVDPVTQTNSCLDASLCECEPDCLGKQCGSNGCGGSCGDCPDGTGCLNGSCGCVPDCDGKVCGENGCGGSCGNCGPTNACEDGACVCSPDCRFKDCGDDGCGGSCGSCAPGASCLQGSCIGSGNSPDVTGTVEDDIQTLPPNTGSGTGDSSGCVSTGAPLDTKSVVFYGLVFLLLWRTRRRTEEVPRG